MDLYFQLPQLNSYKNIIFKSFIFSFNFYLLKTKLKLKQTDHLKHKFSKTFFFHKKKIINRIKKKIKISIKNGRRISKSSRPCPTLQYT
jgi:hypothetical protein